MQPKKDPELCKKIRNRVDKWEKYWTINRSLYYEWIDFVMGDQWREDESKLFERYNKIPMIFNKLGVLANHLMGDFIQNTPILQISPDENVPAETAQARAALIKEISLNSDAKTVYQEAFYQAIVGGYGAYRVGTEYSDYDSFDQVIKIYSIEDPNRCYWDISAKHPCKVDGMYSGFRTRVSRQWFKDKYGEDISSQIGSIAITEDSTIAFADDDQVTIVDDFEKEPEKYTIYQLSDGYIMDDKEFKSLEKRKIDGKKYLYHNGMLVTKVGEREAIRYKIKHRKIAGDFLLDETQLPKNSTLLPVIFVDQKSYFSKQGQQITRSFFKDVKDAQKYLNYLATQSCYLMKISRYDQFIAPRKTLAAPDTKEIWRDPSVVRGALIYDETPSGAKPEQVRPPELSASLTQQYERTLMDIQSGTGMYNTQLGEMGNEVSGKAIDARTNRGTRNTSMPFNSINLAIATGGQVIDEWIPEIYDTERDLVLSMPESEQKLVPINRAMDPYGMKVMNDMTKGKYKIRLKAGPSYEGQKMEALDSLQTVLQADRSGQVFPMIADLYVENLPIDNNIEIRNRLRTIVPPEVIEAGKSGKPIQPKPQPPSPDMLMLELKKQELAQKEQQAMMNAQMKMKELEIKKAEIQRKAIETHQDMTMAFEKVESEKQQAAAELQETLLRFHAESQRIEADRDINHSQNIMKLLLQHHKHMMEPKEKSI